MAVKAVVSWSFGKDSAFALSEARRSGMAEIVGVPTTVNVAYDRLTMHGVRNSLLDHQTAVLGLPCLKIPLPNPCPMDAYEALMADATAAMKARGADHVVFGDLFLEDVRAYRDAQLARPGMTGFVPAVGM